MSGFVDRVRTVRFPKTGERVEGRKVQAAAPVLGPWIRCFFDAGDEGEASGEGGFRRRRSSTLIARPRDTLGGAIDITAQDLLEIQSPKSGQLFMEVVGAPRPMGRRSVRVVEMTLGKTNRSTST